MDQLGLGLEPNFGLMNLLSHWMRSIDQLGLNSGPIYHQKVMFYEQVPTGGALLTLRNEKPSSGLNRGATNPLFLT